jgi:hypothetical protein
LTNDGGTECYGSGLTSSFEALASPQPTLAPRYWSSGSVEANPSTAWLASLGAGLLFPNSGDVIGGGSVEPTHKGLVYRVWPVRNGRP